VKLTRATKRTSPSQLFLPCFVGLVVTLKSLSGVRNLCREIFGVEVHSRVHHGEHVEGDLERVGDGQSPSTRPTRAEL